MTNLMRIRAHWTGNGLVGPSISTFYWDATFPGGPAAIQDFFTTLSAWIPNTVTITVDGTGDIILDTNGALQGTWTESPGSPVVGVDNNSFVLGLGARIVWNTAGIHKRRRVRGSTFIVPLSRDVWDAQGTPQASTLATMQTAANDLVSEADGHFMIWSRPTQAGDTDGTSSAVTGALIPDAVSWLRSRRL